MEINNSSEQQFLFDFPVYYVQSSTDSTVLIALQVRIENEDTIVWFDTRKERSMVIEAILSADSKNFVFKRKENEGGHTYSFTPLSLDIYKANVKPKLVRGEEFTSEDELLNAFKETLNDIY